MERAQLVSLPGVNIALPNERVSLYAVLCAVAIHSIKVTKTVSSSAEFTGARWLRVIHMVTYGRLCAQICEYRLEVVVGHDAKIRPFHPGIQFSNSADTPGANR